MVSIIFLTCVLTIMLAICMLSFKRYLLTPQFGLLVCFILALIGCMIYAKRWNLEFSAITLLVVLAGFASIVFVSLFFQHKYRLNGNLAEAVRRNDGSEISVKKVRVIIWTVIQVVNLYLVIQFLRTQTGTLSLQVAINSYRNSIYLTGDAVALPFFTRVIRSMCIYSSYLFLYLLFYNAVNKIKSKLNKYYIINIVCAAVTSLLIGGSRGSLLQYLIAGLAIYFTLYTFKYYRAFSFKQVFYALVIAGVFLLLFGQMSEWLGRGEVEELGDTLFTYLSGGMANLDTYLRHSEFYKTDRNYTFVELVNFYYRLTGQGHLQYRGLLSDVYMSRRGFGTGNIYTMFASYYHDGEMAAVVLYCALMAFIGQWLLKMTINSFRGGRINIPMVIYGYLFFDYIQCNFSNRFYYQFFTVNMLKFVVFLIAFKFFLTTDLIKIDYKGQRI